MVRPAKAGGMSGDYDRVLEAVHHSYRVELGKQGMQLALYRQALEQAGVDPPDRDGDELLRMWRDCAAVITTASEFTASLGSARELIDPTPWTPR